MPITDFGHQTSPGINTNYNGDIISRTGAQRDRSDSETIAQMTPAQRADYDRRQTMANLGGHSVTAVNTA